MDGGLFATPTGRMGRPSDLEPELDLELVERTVKEAVTALPSVELIQAISSRKAA